MHQRRGGWSSEDNTPFFGWDGRVACRTASSTGPVKSGTAGESTNGSKYSRNTLHLVRIKQARKQNKIKHVTAMLFSRSQNQKIAPHCAALHSVDNREQRRWTECGDGTVGGRDPGFCVGVRHDVEELPVYCWLTVLLPIKAIGQGKPKDPVKEQVPADQRQHGIG